MRGGVRDSGGVCLLQSVLHMEMRGVKKKSVPANKVYWMVSGEGPREIEDKTKHNLIHFKWTMNILNTFVFNISVSHSEGLK